MCTSILTCTSCAQKGQRAKGIARQLEREFEELRDAFVPSADAEPYHLSLSEVDAYRRGELSEVDQEIAESHLVICVQCRDQAEQPVALAGQRNVHRRPLTWLRIAAVVLAGVVLILVVLFFVRTRNAGPPQQVVVPENTLPKDAPTPGVDSPSPPGGEDVRMLVKLNDGDRQITLNNRGDFVGLEHVPERVRQSIRLALQTGKVEASPTIAQLVGKPSTLLSQSDNGVPFPLLSPVGRVIQTNDQRSPGPLAGAREVW